jgi:NTP pyrophosphatase (non-canonical NTP hydrolase)
MINECLCVNDANGNQLALVSYYDFVAKLAKPMGSDILDLLHGAVGISGEAGELLDAIKKGWVYNKPLDYDNIKEELGDLLFYIQMICNTLDISHYELMQLNVKKLEKRYPGFQYTDGAAQARADKQE